MSQKENETDIVPGKIYRLKDGPDYFGLAPTQIALKIKTGEIPAPIFLSETGRARGWLGSQILEHRSRMAAKRDDALKKAAHRAKVGA